MLPLAKRHALVLRRKKDAGPQPRILKMLPMSTVLSLQPQPAHPAAAS